MPKCRPRATVMVSSPMHVSHGDDESYSEWIDRLTGNAAPTVDMLRAVLTLQQMDVKLTPEERIKIASALTPRVEKPPPPELLPVTESWVYFIRCGDVVKIGTTIMTPEARLRSMQAPPDAHVVAAIPGAGRAQEAQLHRRFAASRVHGEWFTSTPELEALIATFAV